jgi:uncharacterized protein (TIGR00255 family)
MTGYASVQHNGAEANATNDQKPVHAMRLGLEIRAVNSRFLDLTFRLPDELRSCEPALRERLGARLKRGKVELRAALESNASGSLSEPSVQLLQRLNSVQDNIRAWLPNVQPLGVADVIRLASINLPASKDWQPELMALADQALLALLDSRAREGARLVTMLQDRIDQLRTLAAQAKPLIPQLVELQRQRFMDRWQEVMGLADATQIPESAQDRALTEATAFAIRIDVAEELTRLASHLDELERLISKGGDIGKRLDFLIQELHREANTLGSKSAALELTHISIDMKVLIEQMREQVQNIE